MSKNSILIAIAFLSYIVSGYSQNPWNKTYGFGLIQANGFGLIEYNERYFVMGQGLLESDPNLERNTFYISVDIEGSYVNDILLDDGPDNTAPSFNNLCRDIVEIDGALYSIADDIGATYMLKTDYNLNSLLILYDYSDPLHNLGGFTPMSCSEFPKGYFTGVTETGYLPTPDAQERIGRIFVTRVDPSNNDALETFYYQIDGEDIRPRESIIDNDGNMIILGYLDDYGVFAMKIDQDMQLVASQIYRGQWKGSYMVAAIDENDDIMIGLTHIERIGLEFYTKPLLMKLDRDLDSFWVKPFVQDSLVRDNNTNYITGIIEAHEEDGFVICGNENSDRSKVAGIISRIDTEGDTIWYKTVRTLQNVPRRNQLFSVIATSDGNYMASGFSVTTTFHDSIGSWSQTWLVKFDGDGHVVEDGVSVAEPSFTDEIRLYPNPSSDYMYIEHDDITGVRYQLYDAVGRIVYATDDVQPQSINMLDVSIYDPGIYYLHISVSGTDDYNVEKLVIE